MAHQLNPTTTSLLNGAWIDEDTKSKIMELTSESEDPFYIYDVRQIKDVCARFRNIPYQTKHIHFATMANINGQFLKILKQQGLSVFVNSLEHLSKVKEYGFTKAQIVFTSSAMSEKAMRLVEQEVSQINLDSALQLETWQRLFPDQKVGIRCNLGDIANPVNTHAGYFIGKESRLGLSTLEIRLMKGNRDIMGLHLYVGTNIFNMDYFIRCYNVLIKMASYFPNLEYLNFGGGFGIKDDGSDSFSLEEYGYRVTELMNMASAGMKRKLALYLEPGRIIGGKAGYFVGKVTDIKERPEQTFIGINASSVQFPRPLFYPDSAKHPVFIIRDGQLLGFENLRKSSVYGCSTYSRDFFLRNSMLPEVRINDIVVFGNAGSYCASAYTQFLGFAKPKEYFV